MFFFCLKYTLGGLDDAFERKNRSRSEFGLELISENPAKVIARMAPISPPLAGAECLEMQGQTDGGSSARRAKRQVFSFLLLSMNFILLIFEEFYETISFGCGCSEWWWQQYIDRWWFSYDGTINSSTIVNTIGINDFVGQWSIECWSSCEFVNERITLGTESSVR